MVRNVWQVKRNMASTDTDWPESSTAAFLTVSPSNDSGSDGIAITCSLNVYIYLTVVLIYSLDIFVILILAVLPVPNVGSPSSSSAGACCGLRSKLFCCIRRGCIYPLNMLDGYEHRLSYACVFGSMTVQLVDLLVKENTMSGALDFSFVMPPSPALAAVTLTVNVAVVTFAFYPLFLCITSLHQFTGSALGLIGAALRLCIKLWTVISCREARETRFVVERFKPLFYNLPSIVFFAILCGKFGVVLVRCIRKRQFGYVPKEQVLAEDHHVLHVRRLLGPSPLPWIEEDLSQVSIFNPQKIKAFFRYKPSVYFKFPTRLVATFTIMATSLYQIGLLVIFKVYAFFKNTEASFKDATQFEVNLFDNFNLTTWLPDLARYSRYSANLWIVVTCMTCIMALTYLYHTGICYRKHIYRIYSGDRRIFPSCHTRLGNSKIMTNAVRYAGLQIAFFMWGFVLIQATLFILLFVVFFVIFVPMVEFNYFSIVQHIAEAILAPIAINLVIYYAQVVMSRFLFLQPKVNPCDSTVPLAVNNRHIYYNVSLFFFFWNIFLGILSAILRVLKGMLLGIFLIPRIDRSVMMRGYESVDNGFMCYLSLLSVVGTHDHPVVKVFLKELKQDADRRRAQLCCPQDGGSAQLRSTTVASRKARQNWLLAYTLVHNPEMIGYRKTRNQDSNTQDGEDGTAKHRVALALRKKKTGKRTSELYRHDATESSFEHGSTERLHVIV